MHGQRETSLLPRITTTVVHAALLAVGGWICFHDGSRVVFEWLGATVPPDGNPTRHLVLFVFGVVLFIRMTFVLFVLLERRFDWSEMGGVLFALFLYQIVFALLGSGAGEPLGALDALGILLYLGGSAVNSGSELQRRHFKSQPENRGRLYTGGLFHYARHINYFGDSLWITGWAIVTRSLWSIPIPIFITGLFLFAFIPSLTRHLRDRYGSQFESWAAETKAFFPFVY